MNKDETITNVKSIEIIINEKEYHITKMPLGRYALVLKQLKNLPTLLSEKKVNTLNQQELLQILPELLADASEELFGVLSAATGIPDKVIRDDADLEALIDMVIAIFTLNKFENIKKKVDILTTQWNKINAKK